VRRQGKWDEAERYLRQAIELSPVGHEARRNLLLTLLRRRKFDEAVRTAEESIALFPDEPGPYANLSWIHWAWTGDAARSRAALERMPDVDRPRAAEGRYFHDMCVGNYNEALKHVEPDRTGPSTSSGYWRPMSILAGLAHEQLGDRAAAVRAYEEALAVVDAELTKQPDDFRLYLSRGLALAGLDRKEEAIRSGEHGAALYPVSKDTLAGPLAQIDLAKVYVRTGEYEKALETLEGVLSIPSEVSARLLTVDPWWEPLRSEPGFDALVERFSR